MKECYYDILGILRTATDSDLKKAYRVKALEYHPDKNIHDPESARSKFILVQQAYEVLSDPHERAWYDSHRDQILQDSPPGAPLYGIQVDQLMPYFSASVHTGYHERAGGFYEVYRRLFGTLLEEELQASHATPLVCLPPSFGDAASTEQDVCRFYDFWKAMATCKSFTWLDPWKPSHAHDRKVRRLMEKENNKRRAAGKREYNDVIHKLAEYLYKRDPRVKAFKAKADERRQKQQQQQLARQKQLKKEITTPYIEQEWSKVIEPYFDDSSEFDSDDVSECVSPDDDPAEPPDTDPPLVLEMEALDVSDDLFCAACQIAFPNTLALEAHQTTASHVQCVQALRETLLHHDDLCATSASTSENIDACSPTNDVVCEVCEKTFASASQYTAHCKNKKHVKALRAFAKLKGGTSKTSSSSSSSFSHSPSHSPSPQQPVSVSCDATSEDHSPVPPSDATSQSFISKKEMPHTSEWQCNVCSMYFATRNKLFQHIKDEGHAIASKFSGSLDDWDEQQSKHRNRKKKRC